MESDNLLRSYRPDPDLEAIFENAVRYYDNAARMRAKCEQDLKKLAARMERITQKVTTGNLAHNPEVYWLRQDR